MECHWAAVIELVRVISHARDSPEPLGSIKVDISPLILQFIAKRQTVHNKYLNQFVSVCNNLLFIGPCHKWLHRNQGCFKLKVYIQNSRCDSYIYSLRRHLECFCWLLRLKRGLMKNLKRASRNDLQQFAFWNSVATSTIQIKGINCGERKAGGSSLALGGENDPRFRSALKTVNTV